jgi:crossover junction endodeoxyribonuclease RuvC
VKLRILGIDPGTIIMGYGVLEIIENKPKLVSLGYVDLTKIKTHYEKLKHIHERVTGIINSFHPDELAIESPFYGENVQSMLKLGRAQGSAIVAAVLHGLPVFEYSPKKIKVSLTGNGNASKIQVAKMLQNLLNIEKLPSKLDATDGLAAAYCHYVNKNLLSHTKKDVDSWKDFIKNNPDKIL